MQTTIPKNYSLAYSHVEIATRIVELGAEVSSWVAAATRAAENEVLAACVLRGGAFFFTDLLRSIPQSVEPTYCRVRSYNQSDNALLSKIKVEMSELHVLGRPVLLVDDICESGATLERLERYCLDQGAHSVKSVVLIERMTKKKSFSPAWAGFRYPGDEWFVGYGMDDRNHFANLPDVYIVNSGLS